MEQDKQTIVGGWFVAVGTVVVLGALFISEVPFNKWVVAGGGGLMTLGAWMLVPMTLTDIADQVRGALPFLDDPDGAGQQ